MVKVTINGKEIDTKDIVLSDKTKKLIASIIDEK